MRIKYFVNLNVFVLFSHRDSKYELYWYTINIVNFNSFKGCDNHF